VTHRAFPPEARLTLRSFVLQVKFEIQMSRRSTRSTRSTRSALRIRKYRAISGMPEPVLAAAFYFQPKAPRDHSDRQRRLTAGAEIWGNVGERG
jgi:hypothetical protein